MMRPTVLSLPLQSMFRAPRYYFPKTVTKFTKGSQISAIYLEFNILYRGTFPSQERRHDIVST